MNIRKQFEKETGKVAYYKDPDNNDYYTQYSYEYSEWLEKRLEKVEKNLKVFTDKKAAPICIACTEFVRDYFKEK